MPTIVSGNAGRLIVDGVTVGTIKSWKLTKTTTAIGVPNFESPVDGDSNVWPEQIPGLSGATVAVEGYFDVDPTTATDSGTPGLSNGLFVTMDLILEKSAPWGYDDVFVLITSFAPGANIENQASSFSLEGTASGIVLKSSVVT